MTAGIVILSILLYFACGAIFFYFCAREMKRSWEYEFSTIPWTPHGAIFISIFWIFTIWFFVPWAILRNKDYV